LSEVALVRTQKVLQKLTEEASLPFWVPVEFLGLSWSISSALATNPYYFLKQGHVLLSRELPHFFIKDLVISITS